MSFKSLGDMSKVLIIFEDNWADEMDIQGSKIMFRKDWERYISIAEQCFNDLEKSIDKDNEDRNPIEYSIEEIKNYWDEYSSNRISFAVGSNEEIEYKNFEEFRRCFKVYDLAEGEADILAQFNFDNFGFFPDWIFDEWQIHNSIDF